jgi:DNA-binding LacI/PurR family transcriptional regulator
MKIPDDISVIGFDDLHASHAIPALTTVSHMLPELGAQAVQLALSSIEGRGARRAATRRVSSKLVVRQSTGPARKRSR